MRVLFLIAILAAGPVLATVLVVALYRHKRAGAGDIKLIGEVAQVEVQLDPEGTVIVCGELWRARSNDGGVIPASSRVRVVDFEAELVVVEVFE